MPAIEALSQVASQFEKQTCWMADLRAYRAGSNRGGDGPGPSLPPSGYDSNPMEGTKIAAPPRTKACTTFDLDQFIVVKLRSAVQRSSPMVTTDKLFAGSIPEIYDRFLVPLIFESYALDLAKRLAKTDPRETLETAAGTGVLTRAIASRLPRDARIVATDLNQPMLNRAMAHQSDNRRVDWRPADALALPFENQSFDVVVCQFGAMFFPDKVQAYKEARRVLKPSGHYFFNVWDRISQNDFADVVTQALAALFPYDPPRFLSRTPHGYHDVERIREELHDAGFMKISVDAVDERSKASSPYDPAIAYCQGTPLRNEIEARDASLLKEATKRAADALAHRFGSGAVDGRIRAFVITAIR